MQFIFLNGCRVANTLTIAALHHDHVRNSLFPSNSFMINKLFQFVSGR